MAQDIIDGINPTRMELLSLKNRTKLAVKGHGLLKEKRDALIKEFFDILDRVKGIRENAEKSLQEANDALIEAQIAMGDLAVKKASLSVKESIDVNISSRSVMGVNVPSGEKVPLVKMIGSKPRCCIMGMRTESGMRRYSARCSSSCSSGVGSGRRIRYSTGSG